MDTQTKSVCPFIPAASHIVTHTHIHAYIHTHRTTTVTLAAHARRWLITICNYHQEIIKKTQENCYQYQGHFFLEAGRYAFYKGGGGDMAGVTSHFVLTEVYRASPLPRETPEDDVSLVRGDARPRRGRSAEVLMAAF